MSKYVFAKENPTELVAYLKAKANKAHSYNTNSLVFQRALRSYNYFYSRFYINSDGSKLVKLGEKDELIGLGVNHFRSIINHLLALVTSNRLAFDCMAESTDVAARDATIIGNEVIDQQFYEKRVDTYLYKMIELGLVMGTSFLTVEWNPYDKLIGKDGEGALVYSGAPKIKVHSLYDVIYEPFKDDYNTQNWVCVREIINRYDLAALYPEKEEEILAQPKIEAISQFDPYYECDEDHCYLYKLYHKESLALPAGRYTVFLDDETVLDDGPNPYVSLKEATPNGGLPVFCFRPSIQYGSSYGYSIAFDMLPIQECLNITDSALITNINTHAINNIVASTTSGINVNDLNGGNRLIEYTPDAEAANNGMPSVLNLLSIPKDLVGQRDTWVRELGVLSGINEVMRGMPGEQLRSGTALALVATQAQSFNSNLEANYIKAAEDIAFFLVYIISRFQTTEELVSLIGKGKSNEIKSFKGKDLSPIKRIKVLAGNPLSRTLGGKIELADMLTKNQLLKRPEQVLEVMQTGNLMNVFDEEASHSSYIKWENEQLLRGEQPTMLSTDNHPLHMNQHKTLLDKPDVRGNPQLSEAIFMHIVQHADAFEQMSLDNPAMLALAMGQPIPMPTPDQSTGIGQPEGGQAASPQVPEGMQQIMGNSESALGTGTAEGQAMKAYKMGEKQLMQANAANTVAQG